MSVYSDSSSYPEDDPLHRPYRPQDYHPNYHNYPTAVPTREKHHSYQTHTRGYSTGSDYIHKSRRDDIPYGSSKGVPPDFVTPLAPYHHGGSSQVAPNFATQPRPYRHGDRASNHVPSRPRYRNAEDYHYDYRGGFRPALESEYRDGYGTDGSGSGYREGGSIRGYENYRYPENQALLPRDDRQSAYGTTALHNGTTHAKGESGGEKQPFLGGVEPVRLTPSWEQSNVPQDELNFKNVSTFDVMEMDQEPPKDKMRLVFMTLVLHGVGTLMPWNMFITAKNYFVDYKLSSPEGEEYATNFLPYIGYASQLPNVIFNWLNIFVQMGGNLTTRIVWTILIEVFIFVITVVLAMVDSSSWPDIFFWTTIVTVVILNIANGIYQNTVYGMAARLPFKYTGAVVLGSNISGTFTAVINIIAIAMAPNQRTSAIYYFITALFVLLACFDTYFALPLNKFYRYHESQHEKVLKTAKRDQKPSTPYWHIFKCAFPQLFNVFMVFFVTLAVFPAVLADICRTDENFILSSNYFQAVTCYLTFNLFAMLGNMLPALFTWPGPRFLCIPVLLRLFFIPAFIFCNFVPKNVVRIMPVFITSDWGYWVLSVFLGITSGYYSSLAMMYCPRTVEPEYAPVAGMMGAASLITGIFAGINFQIVCTWLVTSYTFEIPGYKFPVLNCTQS
ncbi:equilibrative nucleoside transporter 2 isoform X2 [Oratosquilla oratoria]|uniref:equilibrative nucleoside transporter 2 isoform X2 n=1 Tax=Oratosquilla oratoria TaxID=337810 RepID=UPI003F76F671